MKLGHFEIVLHKWVWLQKATFISSIQKHLMVWVSLSSIMDGQKWVWIEYMTLVVDTAVFYT